MKKNIMALAIASFAVNAFAAIPVKDLPKPLQTPAQGGMMVVEKKFDAAPSLDGWVIKANNGEYSVVFTTKDQKSLIAGALIDETGKNLTAEYAEKYIPKPDFAAAWGDVVKAGAKVVTGELNKPKATIYVFTDPNCVYCKMFWKAVQPYQKAGLQVHWIPVAFLAPDSATKAASILQSATPGKALDEYKSKFEPGKASAPLNVTVSDATKAELASNGALMQRLQIKGTPGIVYKDKNGNVLVKGGMPRLKDIAEMTGIPEIKNEDPELARFQ